MSSPLSKKDRDRIRRQTKRIRQTIDAMDLVSSGTLLTRTKVCGRPNCRCAVDSSARHGPYYEWNRLLDGRLVHSVISDEQAELVALAIENQRQIKQLLQLWEAETTDFILNPDGLEEE
jgi:hypothetical protein